MQKILLCRLLGPVIVWGTDTFFFFYSLASLYYLKMNCICYLLVNAPPPCQNHSVFYHLPILFWDFPSFVLSGNFITSLLILSSRLLICCISSTKLVQIMILKAFHYLHPSKPTCFNSQDSYAFHTQDMFLFFFNQRKYLSLCHTYSPNRLVFCAIPLQKLC